jgi:hypothetical protein
MAPCCLLGGKQATPWASVFGSNQRTKCLLKYILTQKEKKIHFFLKIQGTWLSLMYNIWSGLSLGDFGALHALKCPNRYRTNAFKMAGLGII